MPLCQRQPVGTHVVDDRGTEWIIEEDAPKLSTDKMPTYREEVDAPLSHYADAMGKCISCGRDIVHRGEPHTSDCDYAEGYPEDCAGEAPAGATE